jgi:signal transduction histidine kinase
VIGVACLGVTSVHPAPAGTEPVTTSLVTAASIRGLSATEAAEHRSVQLRGVVVVKPSVEAIVLHDDHEGIYVQAPPELLTEIVRGELIEVRGRTDPGGFAPMVVASVITRLGVGPVPEPRRVRLDQLSSGTLDGQWIEVSGVVRTCESMAAEDFGAVSPAAQLTPEWQQTRASGIHTKLKLASGADRVPVHVHTSLPAEQMVDAEVRVRGICFNRHNLNRQFLGALVLVPEGEQIVVERPPSPEPFTQPPRSVASLLQYDREADFNHVVHVRGIVTHHSPGKALWIHDGASGLRVETRQDEVLRVGDEVDVVGFAVHGGYTPMLEDVLFRKRGERAAPPAVRVKRAAQALAHDADLVHIEATLVELRVVPDGWVLTLHWDGQSIKALLENAPEVVVPLDRWRVGSTVAVTGICSVVTPPRGPLTGIQEPETFKLLLRSPDDVRIVKPAPWWTTEKIVWLLSGVAGVSLLTVGAVVIAARLRLREQAVQRTMAETEFSAILRERNRLAREIHDTLAQGLNATSVQLELAKNALKVAPHPALDHVQMAHQAVRDSLTEARSSIWNMRSQALENGDLASALENVLRLLARGKPIEANLSIRGRRRRLAPAIENNLLRVGQEAIVNATKHAKARSIAVDLEFGETEVRLSVTDDGIGFDPRQAPRSESGFGLVGMRERAAQLHSELVVESRSGGGTRVALTVPASG